MQAIVWSKENCPQCDRSKALLTSFGIQYEERIIGVGYTREQLMEAVPTARAVPQIFIDGEYVGSYSELVDRLKQ